jgi:MFS family permease
MHPVNFYECGPPIPPTQACVFHASRGEDPQDIPLHIVPSPDSKFATSISHEEIIAQRPSRETTSFSPQTALTVLQATLLMLVLCTTVFLAALDTVILTTALPTITSSLHTSASGAAWIGASFMLTNASSIPFWGSSSNIFGRKPLLLLATSIFMVGSLVSALAGNLAVLLAGRSIQGIGAGGITVLANIIVSDVFVLRTRGLMLALVGSVWSFAAMVGPVMGGAMAERAGWRWCFWVNSKYYSLAAYSRYHLCSLTVMSYFLSPFLLHNN